MYNNINDLSIAPAIKRISMAAIGAISLTLGTAGVGRAIVTYGDPNDPRYIAQPGMFSGVGSIDIGNSGCTGTLLNGGYDVLTAAHCIGDEDNNLVNVSAVGNTTVTFNIAGSNPIPVSNFYIDPDFQGLDNPTAGGDIAVLQLAKPAPANVQQYDIYRSTDEVDKTFTKVGYGLNGTGNTGSPGEATLSNPDGKLRYGQNQYDSSIDIFKNAGVTVTDNGQTVTDNNGQPVNPFGDTIPGSQLVYGFTNGNPDNDPFQVHFGFPSYTGPLESEVFPSGGDSGGPGFIGNLIASVTSYGLSDTIFKFPDGKQADIDNKYDSSFGEFNSDTRVSYYQNFIDGVLAGTISPTPVPEPSTTWGLFTLGGLGVFSLLRRKKF